MKPSIYVSSHLLAKSCGSVVCFLATEPRVVLNTITAGYEQMYLYWSSDEGMGGTQQSAVVLIFTNEGMHRTRA